MARARKAGRSTMAGTGAGNPDRPQKPASTSGKGVTARKVVKAKAKGRAVKRAGRRSAY